MNYEQFWAERTRYMPESPIRELLSQRVTYSFGGGYPAPITFPSVQEMLRTTENTLIRERVEMMQYGRTEGYDKLLKALPGFLLRRGIEVTPLNILPTTG